MGLRWLLLLALALKTEKVRMWAKQLMDYLSRLLLLSLLLLLARLFLLLTKDRDLRLTIARSRRCAWTIARSISWATIPISWTSKSSNWTSWTKPVVKHRSWWSSKAIPKKTCNLNCKISCHNINALLGTKGSHGQGVAHTMVLVQIFPLQGHVSKVYLHLGNGLIRP